MTFQLTLWQWILVFAVSAAAVMGAGTFLARAGDSIATRTRLGGLFVGMLLMASATSLPEIVTDVSAALTGAPDLAVADLFGSSMANMAILGLLDLMTRRTVWPGIELGHARIGAIAITLTALIVLGVVGPTGIRIGWLGIEPIVVVVGYVVAAAWIGRSDPERLRGAAVPPPQVAPKSEELLEPIGWAAAGGSLRRDLATFAICAAVILVSGPALAISAQGIAEETGIAQTFIGITLLAVASKFIGAFIGAFRSGLWRGVLVGWGMVPRGEVGIVVAGLGLSAGAIDSEIYSVVVGMAILTTLIVPPLLPALLRRAEGHERLPDGSEGPPAGTEDDDGVAQATDPDDATVPPT